MPSGMNTAPVMTPPPPPPPRPPAASTARTMDTEEATKPKGAGVAKAPKGHGKGKSKAPVDDEDPKSVSELLAKMKKLKRQNSKLRSQLKLARAKVESLEGNTATNQKPGRKRSPSMKPAWKRSRSKASSAASDSGGSSGSDSYSKEKQENPPSPVMQGTLLAGGKGKEEVTPPKDGPFDLTSTGPILRMPVTDASVHYTRQTVASLTQIVDNGALTREALVWHASHLTNIAFHTYSKK